MGTTTIIVRDHLYPLLLSHAQMVHSELVRWHYHVVATATADTTAAPGLSLFRAVRGDSSPFMCHN
jgi:hypothetical protein